MSTYRHPRPAAAAMLATLGLLLGAGAAAGRGNCAMEQLAGTYAFESRGSITTITGAASFLDWTMTSRPFVMMGWFNIEPGGSMAGESWVILGRISSGLEARPIVGELFDLDEATCTAVLEWTGSPLQGLPAGTHRERLVFVESGREFRSMLKESSSGTMAWTGNGHRMSSATEVGACGNHLLKGEVLLQCEMLSSVLNQPASMASMALLTVEGDGSALGTWFVKNGNYVPPYFELADVEGAFDVQPNCTVEALLSSPSVPELGQEGRGVIFEQGKHGFLIMPLAQTIFPSFLNDGPAFARCELVWVGR